MKPVTLAAALAFLLPVVASAGGEEIEIYRGEEFTSPGADLEEELHFVRVFTATPDILEKQPKTQVLSKPDLSAAKAMEIAEASLELSGTSHSAYLTKLELHQVTSTDPYHPTITLLFYVADFKVDGSDVQRVILMDGTVVKPQLTRLQPREGTR
ncbi:MAG TPA: hypothetical protein VGE67_13160 [Haloferula sp.]